MHARNKAIAVVGLLLGSFLIPTQASAAVSCVTINKYYPAGVSASKFAKNKGGSLLETPRVKASVYKKYTHLDTDHDRIICEKEAVVAASPDKKPSASKPSTSPGVSISYDLNVVSSNTVHVDVASQVKKDLYAAIDAFDDIALPAKFDVYLYTSKDSNWASDFAMSVGIPMSYIPPFNLVGDCGQAFVTRSRDNTPVIFQCTAFDGDGQSQTVHEYFHIVQMSLGTFGKTPTWLTEGAPTYMQDKLFGTMSPYNRGIRQTVTQAEAIEAMNALEIINDHNGVTVQRYSGYGYGFFAVKHLIDNYGYDKFVSLHKQIANNVYWKTAFVDLYGISLEKFYANLAYEIDMLYN